MPQPGLHHVESQGCCLWSGSEAVAGWLCTCTLGQGQSGYGGPGWIKGMNCKNDYEDNDNNRDDGDDNGDSNGNMKR